MSEKYLKVILVSVVGGLYMIAYALSYIGTRIYGIDKSSCLNTCLDDVRGMEKC